MKQWTLEHVCRGILSVLSTTCAITSAYAIHPAETPLSNIALFHRCYSHITGGLVPEENHPLLVQVRGGTLLPIDACMSILNRAVLVPDNQSNLTPQQRTLLIPNDPVRSYTPYLLANVNDQEASAVMNTFQSLHRQFFVNKDLSQLPSFADNMERFNDPTEPALLYTYLLLAQSAPFSQLVTFDRGLRGMRNFGPWVRNFSATTSLASQLPSAGGGLDRGKLLGIGLYAPGVAHWPLESGSYISSLPSSEFSGNLDLYFSTRRNFGAGVLGLHSYIAINSGFPYAMVPDIPAIDPSERFSGRSNASRRMMRRLTAAALQDVLCRPLPPLRNTDVTQVVANYIQTFPDPATQLPFRSSSNCMACHASMDTLAGVFRGLYFRIQYFVPWMEPARLPPNGSTSPPITFVTHASTQSNFTGLLPPETPPGDELSMLHRDPNFSLRPARGDLRYRSFDGTLVWERISATNQLDGITALGQALATKEDLYMCTASRYLRFFTGINVNLIDSGDPRNAPLSSDDIVYRGIARELATRLRNHQSLRELVRDIISLPLYRTVGLREVLE